MGGHGVWEPVMGSVKVDPDPILWLLKVERGV